MSQENLTHRPLEDSNKEKGVELKELVINKTAGDQVFGKSANDHSVLLATQFHCLSTSQVESELQANQIAGLSQVEVDRRLPIFGLNELEAEDNAKWWQVLLRQIVSVMNLILGIGLALSFANQDWIEAAVILVVVISNTIIGFRQEMSAERNMSALRRMASPTARVMRDTTVSYIAANQVVPGDLLLFEEGDIIPADCRLIECFHLEVDEALLTGESLPVRKSVDVLSRDLPMADRINLVYSSTIASRGRGKAIVIRTGMDTEIGQIARALASSGRSKRKKVLGSGNTKTQLEKSIDIFAYFILILVAVLAFVVFAVNGLKYSATTANYALSVVIAILPEGLTAVITVTMALGVYKMATQKAIVRKRSSLEAVGSVTNICSDKTGTLTQGKMAMTSFFLPSSGLYVVEAQGYKPVGAIKPLGFEEVGHEGDSSAISIKSIPLDLLRFTQCAALCNMSIVKRKGITITEEQDRAVGDTPDEAERVPSPNTWFQMEQEELESTGPNDWEAVGDLTEAALQVFAWKLCLGKPHLESQSTKFAPYSFELLQEYPFDATLKRMSVIHSEKIDEGRQGSQYVFVKGAVESVFGFCNGVFLSNSDSIFESEVAKSKCQQEVIARMESMASRGLRVLALAYRPVVDPNVNVMAWSREEVERDLIFLGLAGIYDPPRPESKEAVAQCRKAGISVHMLTGDHPKTAVAIAHEISILTPNESTIVGKGYYSMTAMEFDKLSDAETDALERLPTVIARCSPVTKVKMVDALVRRNKIVAMTGDGTNDAPSLKKAQVGIAMGMNGSDVAKQASDIILTDDNFATIVKAVSEGRRIFANIQKFMAHLMSGNAAEIIALIIGLAYQDSTGQSVYPMSPVQILFLNMVTSSPPALGLGMESAQPETMNEPPNDNTKGALALFSKEIIADILAYGTVMGVMSLAVWSAVLYNPDAMAKTGNSPLGTGCNGGGHSSSGIPPGCETVFRARATSYMTLTTLLLIHAYNCRSFRQSTLCGQDHKGWDKIKSNRFLFGSCIFGFVSSLLTIYIPYLNTDGFKQSPISWEWTLIAGCSLLFIGFSELYKFAKRRLFPKVEGTVVETLDAARVKGAVR